MFFVDLSESWTADLLAVGEKLILAKMELESHLCGLDLEGPLSQSIAAQFMPSGLFFERILDEVEKSSFTIIKAAQRIQPTVATNDSEIVRLSDELAQKQRKQFEILLNLLSVCKTPLEAHPYWRHLVLHHELKYANQRSQELSGTFGKTSPRLTNLINSISAEIDSLESSHSVPVGPPAPPQIDVSKIFYIKSPKHLKTSEKLFLAALQSGETRAFEKTALGLTYQNLFGRTSRILHFSLATVHSPVTTQYQITLDVESLAILSIASITRCFHMCSENGLDVSNCTVSQDLYEEYFDDTPDAYLELIGGTASVDDLVFVIDQPSGFLARVRTTYENPGTNYFVYDVVPLSNGGADAWVPSNEILLLVRADNYSDFIGKATTAGFVENPTMSERENAIAALLQYGDLNALINQHNLLMSYFS